MSRERKITFIPGTEEKMPYKRKTFPFKQRACAYVRVSTEHAEQMNSLQNQTEYYERLLLAFPFYEYCGIFSDVGISGAKEDRPGFQTMLEKARAGEIDVIITKSISRFARDIVTLLKSVRKLKEVGVAVIFEEQNINTLSSDGELMLSILGAFAEEERKSVSGNLRWAIQSRFKRGDVVVKSILGYDKDQTGNLVINHEGAEIVRRIYKRYLDGISAENIAKELNEAGVPGYKGQPWKRDRVIRMIQNEKYCGDLLLQKNFVESSGKEKKNKGELAQYYIRDNHPAIISREDWDMAQKLRENKRTIYPFTKLLKCPHCGASLVHYLNRGRWVYWVCNTLMEHTKSACTGIRVPERILIAINKETPITEPMVVVEVSNGKSYKKRPKKDYRLIPIAEYENTTRQKS